MGKKILFKRSSVPGKVPSTDVLDIGEIAINLADQKIFTKWINPDTNAEEIITISAAPVDLGQYYVKEFFKRYDFSVNDDNRFNANQYLELIKIKPQNDYRDYHITGFVVLQSGATTDNIHFDISVGAKILPTIETKIMLAYYSEYFDIIGKLDTDNNEVTFYIKNKNLDGVNQAYANFYLIQKDDYQEDYDILGNDILEEGQLAAGTDIISEYRFPRIEDFESLSNTVYANELSIQTMVDGIQQLAATTNERITQVAEDTTNAIQQLAETTTEQITQVAESSSAEIQQVADDINSQISEYKSYTLANLEALSNTVYGINYLANLIKGAVTELSEIKVDKIGADDINIVDENRGLILKDRTTGDSYRLYIDNGVLGIEKT